MTARTETASDIDCLPDDNLDGVKDPSSRAISFHEAPLFCFLKKMEHWITLSALDRQRLLSAALRPEKLNANETFGLTRQETHPLIIVQSGVVFAFSVLPNGERHISSVYYPGDILSYTSFLTGRPVTEFAMATKSELIFLEPDRFSELLSESPGLAQVIALTETARTLFTSDRFAAATRLQAYDCILHLLLELKAGQELSAESAYDEFHLYLTQEHIADMLGLTSVYVSKTLARLDKDGVIERQRRRIRFADRSESELQVGFINRYQQIKSWRPPLDAPVVANAPIGLL